MSTPVRPLLPRLLPAVAAVARAATLCAVLLAAAWPAQAQRKACLDCHQDFKKHMAQKFVHAPAGENCEKCHMRHGFTQQLVLTKKLPELCLDCHASVAKEMESAHVHGALSEGGCAGCHDSHAADNKALLVKGEGGRSVCLGCHENLAAAAAAPNAHDPFKKGNCEACHAPHASERANLLVADEAATCAPCHKNVQKKHEKIPGVADLSCTDCHDPHTASKKARFAANSHPPFAEGDCESCHTVENKEVEMADGFPPADLCESCHDDVTASLAGNESHFGADPLKQGGTATCLKCHDAHRSREEGMLVSAQKDLCRSCHESLPQVAPEKGSMHPPFAGGDCAKCHEPHGGGGEAHLAKSGAELCSSCHADIVAPAKPGEVVHAALEASDCRDCHASHASAEPALLKHPEGEVCAECHEKTEFSHQHPPYLQNNCGACHSNHARTPNLLAGQVNEICGQCHHEQLGALKATFPHPPAKDENCLSCHSPHGSEHEGLLTETQKGLCTGCHDIDGLVVKTAAAAAAPPQVHAPVEQGRCAECHEPHGATRKWLVRTERDALCYGCHTTEKVAFMEGRQHAPVAEGNCDACHTPHGSTAGALRLKDEPALCTQCHDFTKPPLSGSHKGFDVTKAVCTSCHTPHNSKEPHLLNPVVHAPFADGDCESCHEGGKAGTGAMATVSADACFACHDDKQTGKGHQHAAGVACTSCHQPHSSQNEHLLVSPSRLCQNCHADIAQAGAGDTVHRHRPVEEGRCLDCHQMHDPAAEKHLAKQPLELCSSCHASVAARATDKTRHDPFMKGNCAACHEVHASAQPNLLKRGEDGLCKTCHGLTTAKMTAAHPGVPLKGRACTTCHDPHSTKQAGSGLVMPTLHAPFKDKDCEVCHDAAGNAAATVAVCADCHENTKDFRQAHSAGRTGEKAAEVGVCMDCHSPHAGHEHLMKRSTETQTCMQCHDRRDFTRKTVHAALDGGCTTCHDVHDRENLALRGAAVNDKCAECHDAAATHAHPTSPDKRDPRTRGPLTCVGCHEPHSSDYEHMLTHDQKRDLCVQCHSAGMER